MPIADKLAQRFGGTVNRAATRYHVNPDLVWSVMGQESSGNPGAISGKGASGLMQLMPATARSLGVTNPNDPNQNITAGTHYLSQLWKHYDGDVPRVLAAYNAGPGNVAKYKGVPPFKETQNYVNNVAAEMERRRQMRQGMNLGNMIVTSLPQNNVTLAPRPTMAQRLVMGLKNGANSDAEPTAPAGISQ